MKAIGEAYSLGDACGEEPRAKRETLPGHGWSPNGASRIWMLVEHYLALNEGATLARALERLGITPEAYLEAKRRMVDSGKSYGNDVVPGRRHLKRGLA